MTPAEQWGYERDHLLALAARLELARAALAWRHARAAGRVPGQIEEVRAPFLEATPRHPLTGETARLDRDSDGEARLSFSGRDPSSGADPITWVLESVEDEKAPPQTSGG